MSSIFSGMGASGPGLLPGLTFQPQPPISGPAVQTAPPDPAPLPAPTEGLPAYAATEHEPQSVSFGTPSPEYLMRTLQDVRSLLRPVAANDLQQLAPVPAGWQPRLESLARALGFPEFRQMQYQLRNLPENLTREWFNQIENQFKALPPTAQTVEKLTEITRQELDAIIGSALKNLFEQARAPLPVFRAEGGAEWTPGARLSVFNALTEIRQSQPDSTFRKATSRADGQPLTFTRAAAPVLNAQEKALTLLSQMMKVACHDTCTGQITLSDGAVQLNPRELLANPAVQAFIKRANQPGNSPDKQQALASVQELLNFSRPTDRQLPLTGQLDETTRGALRTFEMQQHLLAARDILDDDRALEVPAKRTEHTMLQSLLFRLRQGESPEVIQHELQSHLSRLLTIPGLQTQSRQRLEQLSQQNGQPLKGLFDQALLEKQTANWYGIIDGGQQLDFTEQVVVHELGHGLDRNLPEVLKNWQKISWETSQNDASQTADMRATLNGIGKQGFASSYGRVNASEDFAEAYRVFTYQPERLLQNSLLKFVFMAGITGAYQGKEAQMLALIEKAGYKEAQIKEAVLHLRGQLPDALTQEARHTVEGYSSLLKMASPLLGHGLDLLASASGIKEQLIETLKKKQEPEKVVQFDPQIASTLPGLNSMLGIQGREYTPQINDSGYVLENLSQQQAQLLHPDLSVTAREKARTQIKTFAEQGLNSFSALEQRTFSPRVRDFLDAEPQSRRAVLLALSKILGKSYAVQALRQKDGSPFEGARMKTQLNLLRTSQINYLKDFLNRVQHNPEILRQELGSELYQALPESFIALLQEPDFVSNITGNQSEISISTNTIFDYTAAELQKRDEKLQYFKGMLQDLLECLKLENADIGLAYEMYQPLAEAYNSFRAQKSPLLTQTQFAERWQTLKTAFSQQGFAPDQTANQTQTTERKILEQKLLQVLGLTL